MKNQKFPVPTLDEIKSRITALVGAMDATQMFKRPVPVQKGLDSTASLIEAGDIESAVKAGMEVLLAGRSILGAFLRYSVISRSFPGQSEQIPLFTREILNRKYKTPGYDKDLLEKLEVARARLEKAVCTENGEEFKLRVPAYNAMRDTLASADKTQTQRDRTAIEVARQALKTKVMLNTKNRSPREQVVMERVRVAEGFRALL